VGAENVIRIVDETENGRLKKLLAESELGEAMLKELAEGNFGRRRVVERQINFRRLR
jgi:hypothetical protein